jgi:hypothetical protein
VKSFSQYKDTASFWILKIFDTQVLNENKQTPIFYNLMPYPKQPKYRYTRNFVFFLPKVKHENIIWISKRI